MIHKMRFSEIEKQHLLKAWIAISFAFAVLYSSIFSIEFIVYFIVSLLTVGLGFLLHELAHKYVAQKYGCWAEFRADDKMLLFAVLFAFIGFLFAAPGAVLIYGHVTKEKNGKISIAGPAMNFILAIFFLIIILLMKSEFVISALAFGLKTNAWIGLFNLIPVGNFDGRKILYWNKPAYIVMAAVGIILVITSLLGLLPGL
ncbi:MAG: hypothetical protein ABIJ34_09465 [archaeon]